jgi:hypothetical protein
MTFRTIVFSRGKISKSCRVHSAVYKFNSFVEEAAAQTQLSNSDDTVSTLKKIHKGLLFQDYNSFHIRDRYFFPITNRISATFTMRIYFSGTCYIHVNFHAIFSTASHAGHSFYYK